MKSITRKYLYLILMLTVLLTAINYYYLPIVISYLLAINFMAFSCMGVDKRAAIRGQERIPESLLLALAALAGGLGILLGGSLFRHKTRKRSFYLPVITLTLIYIIIYRANQF